MENTTSSANWAGVTSQPCGWPGTSSMIHSLLPVVNAHSCFYVVILTVASCWQTLLSLWLQGEEVCCNEGSEERRTLHRDGSG